MRDDMQKVVVERPRRGSRYRFERRKPRRIGEDFEGYVGHEAMRRAHRDHKELSDYLSPLYRYLDKQAGRPWNDVWSEISQRLDFRSVLGFHIKSHIDQHVSRHVRMIGDRAHEIARFAPGGWAPVYGMYVDPDTGLLKRGCRWNAWRNANGQPVTPAWKVNKYEALRRIVDERAQIHFHEGQWYEVALGARPDPEAYAYEVKEPNAWGGVTRTVKYTDTVDVLRTPSEDLEKRYGRKGVAAISKRQISRREKRRYGLR